MFEKTIEPRFSETDALGHINNNVYSIWFESAREPIFRIFTSSLKIDKLDLIMAHISCDFIAEVFYGEEVLIKTVIERIGNSSFDIKHTLYQDNKLCAIGKATMVHFDHKSKKSMKLDDSKIKLLEKHLELT